MPESISNYDFEHAPCGYLAFDPDGTILQANQTLLQWINYPKEEVVNVKKLDDITPRGTNLYLQLFVFPSLKMQGYINELSLDIIGAGQTVTSCLFNASAVKNEDGSLRHLHAILFRISERKKYEVELLNEKKTAENIVKHKEHILQAQRRIMSILGHDTRAPIFSINRIIKFAIEGKMSQDEVFSYFELMANQLDATLILIENLLTWSNAHFDTDRKSQIPLSLRSACKDIFKLLQSNAAAKGLFLTTQIDPSIFISSHQAIISFIIRNLVNNAIKFTNEGGVTVSAELEGNIMGITVSDTGTGMNQDQVTKYKSGELSSTAGTQNETGSGMGLMLINEFLFQLNGKLEVESTPGNGSSITIKLPPSSFVTATPN